LNPRKAQATLPPVRTTVPSTSIVSRGSCSRAMASVAVGIRANSQKRAINGSPAR